MLDNKIKHSNFVWNITEGDGFLLIFSVIIVQLRPSFKSIVGFSQVYSWNCTLAKILLLLLCLSLTNLSCLFQALAELCEIRLGTSTVRPICSLVSSKVLIPVIMC